MCIGAFALKHTNARVWDDLGVSHTLCTPSNTINKNNIQQQEQEQEQEQEKSKQEYKPTHAHTDEDILTHTDTLIDKSIHENTHAHAHAHNVFLS